MKIRIYSTDMRSYHRQNNGQVYSLLLTLLKYNTFEFVIVCSKLKLRENIQSTSTERK